MMKLIGLIAVTCATVAFVATSAGCSPYYCYSAPKIDLSVAMPDANAAPVGESVDVAPRMTLKSVVEAVVATGSPKSNCLGTAF